MPKISVYRTKPGCEKELISETETTIERFDKIRERLKRMMDKKKEKSKKIFADMPEIHMDILRLANKMSKSKMNCLKNIRSIKTL